MLIFFLCVIYRTVTCILNDKLCLRCVDSFWLCAWGIHVVFVLSKENNLLTRRMSIRVNATHRPNKKFMHALRIRKSAPRM